jgi:ketosteroid isomerase-like protein
LRGVFALLLLLTALRCASAPASGVAGDLEKEKTALLRADADFSAMAQARGIGEAFATYAAENATMMPMGEKPAVGRAAIRKEFEGMPAEARLVWKPYAADVSRSGDIGYTLGTYEYRAPSPDGKMVTRYGKYCTVWKKQADGSWKWVADIGNTSPAPQ